MENKKYKAIIIGATGAVGRELVDELLASPYYDLVTVYVRRKIDRWEHLSPEQQSKLQIHIVDNLDFLGNTKEELLTLTNNVKYDVLFNTLGSRVGRGEEEFRKVDYTYVVQSCEVCEKLNIQHYSNCSAMNEDKTSWFLYSRVKGEAEEEMLKKNVPYISIARPGIILNRDNDDRFGEKVVQWVPFIPKISSKDIAKAMLYDDLVFQRQPQTGSSTEKKGVRINNDELLALVDKYNKEDKK